MKVLYEISTLNIVKPRNQMWSDYNIKIPSSEILAKKGLAVIELPDNAFEGLTLPKLKNQSGVLVVVEGFVAAIVPELSFSERLANWVEENKAFGIDLVDGFYLQSLELNLDRTQSAALNQHFKIVEDNLLKGRLDIAQGELSNLTELGFFTTHVRDYYLSIIQNYRAAHPKPIEN